MGSSIQLIRFLKMEASDLLAESGPHRGWGCLGRWQQGYTRAEYAPDVCRLGHRALNICDSLENTSAIYSPVA